MSVRLFSAKKAGEDLAAGRISAREQSIYLIASFLIWIVPAYLFLFPSPRSTDDPQFFWLVWLIELALVALFCIAGIGYCLGKCRVEPARNFLVDFSCLNAPISLTTLAIAWGGFYVLTELLASSARAYDIVRMLTSAGAVLVVFLRIGRHMDRVSLMRLSGKS